MIKFLICKSMFICKTNFSLVLVTQNFSFLFIVTERNDKMEFAMISCSHFELVFFFNFFFFVIKI